MWAPVALVAHATGGLYVFGAARFWLIYAPVCGLFFAMFYYEYTDEGVYFLVYGIGSPIVVRLKSALGLGPR